MRFGGLATPAAAFALLLSGLGAPAPSAAAPPHRARAALPPLSPETPSECSARPCLYVYLDPAHQSSAQLWTQARRLSAERGDEFVLIPKLRSDLPSGGQDAWHQHRVAWLAALIELLGADAAIEEFRRRGADGFGTSARSGPSRERHVQDMRLPPELTPQAEEGFQKALAQLRSKPFARRRLHSSGAYYIWREGALRVQLGSRGDLEALRASIDQRKESRNAREAEPRLKTAAPGSSSKGRSRTWDRRFGQALVIGSQSAPRRLTLRWQPDNLSVRRTLLAALSYLETQPQRLYLQLLVVGDGPDARRHRTRICAARELGFELELLRTFSLDLGRREADSMPDPAGSLLQALDAFVAKELGDVGLRELPPEARSTFENCMLLPALPNSGAGAWLDGRPVSWNEAQQARFELDRPAPSSADSFFLD